MTNDETSICDLLDEAWQAYNRLPLEIPGDDCDFKRAICAAQRIIAYRVAARCNPEYWEGGDELRKAIEDGCG